MTKDNNALFVYNLDKAVDGEDFSYLSGLIKNLPDDPCALLTMGEIGIELFNLIVTCNPIYELVPVRVAMQPSVNRSI